PHAISGCPDTGSWCVSLVSCKPHHVSSRRSRLRLGSPCRSQDGGGFRLPGRNPMHEQPLPLFTMNYGEAVDLSWLAPDQRVFECRGKPITLTGADGQSETLLPCGWLLPFDCFRPKVSGEPPYGGSRRPVHSRCVECEERIRTARNRLNFWGNRTYKAVRRHYRTERKEGLHAAGD